MHTTKQKPTTDPGWEGADYQLGAHNRPPVGGCRPPTGSPQTTPSGRALTTKQEPTINPGWEGADHQLGAHNRTPVGGR
jgi:hypothetical protein